jgi:hypothetical protein
MTRNIWISVLAVAAVSAGGLFYYVRHESLVSQTSESERSSREVLVVEPKPSDEELNKKRQEGIGSVRDLKPVPLGSASNADKGNAK